ncbi:MAG: sigma-54-dependent Fis family transcriptional regulator, partial [Candidatus Latescibacteria bacterium]|nr:sigma-54-dependent Fis family transcriptional regulator [Candidatus Latescibacterota bacterium]
GLFEAANGGILFLDEIAETLAATQVKLLRVLQDGEIRRVGETTTKNVDVRLICATNRDLDEDVVRGRFREDLYYRLYVLVLPLPALRERREDIPLLIEHFLQGYEGEIGETTVTLLKAYDWPGNIRELDNQIAGAKVLAGGRRIEPEHLWSRVRLTQPIPSVESTSIIDADAYGELTLKEARERFEQEFIGYRLKICGWDVDAAAKGLGLSRSRLYELIRQYGFVKRE